MSLPDGSLETCGERTWIPVLQQHMKQATANKSGAARLEFDGQLAYLKFGPIQGKHRLRHGLRDLLPGLRIPRMQEFHNLEWLRAHGFGAPRPLVAGVVRRLGLPVFQFLATEWNHSARDLRSAAADLPPSVFEELGQEVARLHNMGFTHRDLYPRNILWNGAGNGPQIFFLDAWRGGPKRGLRGPAYDLACLMLFAPLLFAEEHSAEFLRTYSRARSDQPKASFWPGVERLRRRLVRQLIAKGRKRHELPPEIWPLPL